MVIENRLGGGGGIGVDIVAKAAPDGLTLGIAAVAMHAINPWLFSKLPYDPIKDFAFITQMVGIPNVLVMNTETAQRLKIANLKTAFVAALQLPDTKARGIGDSNALFSPKGPRQVSRTPTDAVLGFGSGRLRVNRSS